MIRFSYCKTLYIFFNGTCDTYLLRKKKNQKIISLKIKNKIIIIIHNKISFDFSFVSFSFYYNNDNFVCHLRFHCWWNFYRNNTRIKPQLTCKTYHSYQGYSFFLSQLYRLYIDWLEEEEETLIFTRLENP